jgi:hypothetical protein
MPFDWRDHEELPLEQRFAGQRLGLEPWSGFLRALARFEGLEIDRDTTEPHEVLLSEFSAFLDAMDAETRAPVSEWTWQSHPMVFVSHQRADIKKAERIAYLACNQGIDYWLDIHDPLLTLANRTIAPHDLRYPVIIAAIIEMALLNSTCLIAVHTTNSMASKWVPYELGRVRDRNIQSLNAGGWFHPKVDPSQCGDYVHLCRIARGGEHGVTSWLHTWASGKNVCQGWPKDKPLPIKPLPV